MVQCIQRRSVERKQSARDMGFTMADDPLQATKGLAAEYGPSQIRVNALCPLLSATALFQSFVGVEDTADNRKKFSEAIPLQRLTEPQDVANIAVYLCSDEGKFITGVNLEVDGGRGI